MKIQYATYLLLALLLTITACSSNNTDTLSESMKPNSGTLVSSSMNSKSNVMNIESSDLIQQINALYQQLDRSKLPLKDYNSWHDTTPEVLANLPKQLVLDTPDAYRYAQIIRNYLDFVGNKLQDFDNVESIPFPGVIETAIFHTVPIQWEDKFSTDIKSEDNGLYANHILRALLINEKEEGRFISELYYADDVQNTIRKMFGDKAIIRNRSIDFFIYYKRENVYGQIGDYGGPAWIYPILTSMEPTPDGMICEAVLVTAWDKDTPLQTQGPGSIDLTSDNFEAATAGSAKYRYVFENSPEGDPILTSLHTLRHEQ